MRGILMSKESLARWMRCYIAAGAMRALTEAWLRIPQDVAIIGFDDMPLCAYTSSALSTVGVLKQFMGKIVAHRILARINAPEANTTTTEINTRRL